MRYTWRGLICSKNPFDLALYPILLWERKPATIIEIGSKDGGSALWLADTCAQFGFDVQIISVDINQRAKVRQKNIEFLQGDGRHLEKVLTDERMRSLPRPLLVIEDADHHYLTTLAVLQFMDRHMAADEYLLIEDGICNSFNNEARYDGGPIRAIAEFLGEQPLRYEIDTRFCDFFGYNVTWNPNGYLRRLP